MENTRLKLLLAALTVASGLKAPQQLATTATISNNHKIGGNNYLEEFFNCYYSNKSYRAVFYLSRSQATLKCVLNWFMAHD